MEPLGEGPGLPSYEALARPRDSQTALYAKAPVQPLRARLEPRIQVARPNAEREDFIAASPHFSPVRSPRPASAGVCVIGHESCKHGPYDLLSAALPICT